MHTNADKEGSQASGRWSPAALKSIVAELARRHPDERADRIEQIVQYCKGAVFPAEGRERLIRFATGLLRTATGKSGERPPRGR
ncbi:MAG TPA: hypothetical protein VNR00_06565 [Opitutus sp.]|nr:hypothetical protein [Opitutus sp.]